MSEHNSSQVPQIKRLPIESNGERIRLMVRTAALHFVKDGALDKFAKLLGFQYQIFYIAIKQGYMNPAKARQIEEMVGRDLIQKEILCPSVFGNK